MEQISNPTPEPEAAPEAEDVNEEQAPIIEQTINVNQPDPPTDAEGSDLAADGACVKDGIEETE